MIFLAICLLAAVAITGVIGGGLIVQTVNQIY